VAIREVMIWIFLIFLWLLKRSCLHDRWAVDESVCQGTATSAKDFSDDIVGGYFLGFRLVTDDDSMSQHIRSD